LLDVVVASPGQVKLQGHHIERKSVLITTEAVALITDTDFYLIAWNGLPGIRVPPHAVGVDMFFPGAPHGQTASILGSKESMQVLPRGFPFREVAGKDNLDVPSR
jgi:hypothetical protein